MNSLEGEPLRATWDLEISPTEGFFWGGKYETHILKITHPWVILSFSVKFSDGRHITKGLCDYKGYKGGVLDDKPLTTELHKLLEPVDILIHQNGDKFDVRKLNTRIVVHGLKPLSPKRTVDTLKIARTKFGFTSNTLDDLATELGIGRKTHHEGFTMWEGCMDGNTYYWRKMKKYNRNDVVLTDEVAKILIPFASNLPNMDTYSPVTICTRPGCGGRKLHHRGYSVNKTTKYAKIQCQDCGGWSRAPLNLATKKPITPL